MKKHIILLSILVSMVTAFLPVGANAQLTGNEYAIFNWQNNGDFNAFLNCDIDSITYSKIDLDGRTHPNVVIQEVWTPDSVYRIPLATIDSVSFRAPDPVIKDGLFHITSWHFPYVTAVSDSTVTFNASIPSDSLPSIGQVVITDIYDEPFDHGFAGRVVRVLTTSGRVCVECSPVTIADVYDQLVCVGKSVSYNENGSPSGAPRRIIIDEKDVLTYEISNRSDTLYYKINNQDTSYVIINNATNLCLDYAICYNLPGHEDRFMYTVNGIRDCGTSVKFTKSGDTIFSKDFVSIKIPTKIWGLVAKLQLGGFIGFEGLAELNAEVPYRIQANFGYDSQLSKYGNNGFFANFNGTGLQSPNGHVKLEASAHLGLDLKFHTFFLSERLANAEINLSAGPRFTGTLEFDTDFSHLPSWYDFKDTHITVEPLVASLNANAKTIFDQDPIEWEKPETSIFGEKLYYLFPVFGAPYAIGVNNFGVPTALTTDISRNLIFAVTPGIGLYQNGSLVDSKYASKTYKRQAEWKKSNLQMEVQNRYPSGTYTAVPIFKFFNKTIEASPTSTITIPVYATISTDPTSLDFGNMTVGKTKQLILGVTGTNVSGDISLILLNTCTNAEFTLEKESLSSGDGSVIVTCRATSEGNINGQLVLSAIGANDVRVSISGTAVNPPPAITVSPTLLDFNKVTKGDSKQMTFKVTGSYLTGDLTVSSDNSYYTVSPTSISSTEAANGRTVTVTYQPTATGPHLGAITISGGGATSETVSVKGTCVMPPTISVDQTSLNFGRVTVGETKNLTLTVTGTNVSGNISLILLNTCTNAEFTISPESLPASGGTVTVTCNATSEGNINGQLVLSANGADDVRVSMSGTAVNPRPAITVRPTLLDFDKVTKGDSKQMTFKVTGSYLTGDLTVSSDNSYFKVSPTSISSTESANGRTVTVTYQPTATGPHLGAITISGGGATSETVSVKGTCVKPTIRVDQTSLDFGNVKVGKTKQLILGVTGTNVSGNISLTLLNTCTHAEFTLDKESLSSSGEAVKVTCKATSVGDISGKLILSATGADDVTVILSGKAISTAASIDDDANPLDLNMDVTSTFNDTGSNIRPDDGSNED